MTNQELRVCLRLNILLWYQHHPNLEDAKEIGARNIYFLARSQVAFLSTYLVFVEKMKIEHAGFECTATGQVELVDGKYKFTYIHLYPKAIVGKDEDVEKAELALEKTKKYCLISNSINAEIVQHPEVAIAKHRAVINTAA